MNNKIHRLYNSPTLMTWMSYSTKALSLLGVLPLILKKFSPEDVVIWYLFSTVISMQFLIDFGFKQTFTRLISFAFGGAVKLEEQTGTKSTADAAPNMPLLNNVVSTMKYIYAVLTIIVLVSSCTLGTWSMAKSVNASQHITQSWWAWAIIILVTVINFYSKIYLNILEGLFKIALVRRVESFTSLGAILTTIIVLYTAPTLFNVVLASQFWVLVSSLRDWYLCKTIDDGIYKQFSKKLPFDKVIFLEIWSPAWRSGIGGLLTTLMTSLSAVIYAQFGTSASVAAYLLALRLMTQIKEISMAPFYSKIPLMAIHRVKGEMDSLIVLIKRGMRLSHGAFIFGFIGVAIFITPLLKMLHSNTGFVDMRLWALLGWAFYSQRFGAMHLQAYMTTNHVIAHITDTIASILFLVSSYFLAKYIGIYTVPVGMLIGYLGFHSWYSAMYSYRSLGGQKFWKFERDVSMPFIAVLSIFSIIAVYYKM